ncbi:MAG: SDR family NAD(P)-dependent oxidoreductase [Acidimicrobiia bacterium]|jgi:NAD(P)-dependent dehydrogenase (short-subunit alcohol dehydrogenase family)
MPSVLIVGASRGIGLGLVDVHLQAGWKVHATTRDGRSPRDQHALTAHQLDVGDVEQLGQMINGLEVRFDRIIHNAGIMRAPRAELMEVNALAPIRTVDSLLDADRLEPGGTVSIMTSQMGARRGREGGLGDYGDSKAALNDRFRRISPRWREAGAIAVVIHPGWVRTDMGGRGASLAVGESAAGIKRVMDGLTWDDHGRFLTWDGRVHPW